jgi:serine/threonine protein kinase
MELLEGRSLAQELKARGALPLRDCASIIGPVCDALGEAHRAGIVHRDIKPGNILLSRDQMGEQIVKVLDFGIAKLVEGQSAAPLSIGELAGTPEYMAPERLLGESSEPPSDVYSVGATLYEMLSGKVPFQREGRNALQQALHQIRTTPALLLSFRPDLPHDLVRVVMATLARNASERPGLPELRAHLDHWAAQWSEPEWPPPSLGRYIASLAHGESTGSSSERQTAPLEAEAGGEPHAAEASGTVAIAADGGGVDAVQIEVCDPTLLEGGDPRRGVR